MTSRPAFRRVSLLAALTGFAAFATPASAVDLVSTGSYDAVSISQEYADEIPYQSNSYFATHMPVTGLSKFDPSLGHLTSVKFETTFNFEFLRWLDAAGIDQTTPGTYTSVAMTLDSLDAVIFYQRPDLSNSYYPVAGYSLYQPVLSVTGNVGDGVEYSTGEYDTGSETRSYGNMIGTGAIIADDFLSTGPNDLALDTLTAAATIPVTADFHLVNLLSSIGGATISFQAGEVTMTYTYSIPGDPNGDDQINFTDLLILAQNYGSANATFETGDFNGDGIVSFPDLLILAQSYGTDLTPDSTGTLLAAGGGEFVADWQHARSLVPEPTLGVAVVGLGLIGRRRVRSAASIY